MKAENSEAAGGIGFGGALQLIFITLKLCNGAVADVGDDSDICHRACCGGGES